MSGSSLGLTLIDWLVIGAYFSITITVGLMFSRRAGRSTSEFFLAGRKLPWYLAGGSMVATMFASDTPLFHTGNVREGGLAAGWYFLFPMFGAMLAAAVFAPLVRRTRTVTDAEFIELRYSGRTPAFFRGFLAIYSGLIVASLTMGWVTKGMQATISTVMNLSSQQQQLWAVIILLTVVTLYSMASGMWGVVMTDMFQYSVASVGSIVLAVVAIHHVGGLEGLRSGLAAIPNYSGSDLHFLPSGNEFAKSTGEMMMLMPLIIAWITVNGANQAASVAHQGQRILSCRDERDASLTYVFYSFFYYIVNGIPWFVTGLASILVLGPITGAPGIEKAEQAFPAMIKALMPVGMIGLMVASLFAAFMSTVSVLLNWGGSYLVNDMYRRFIVKQANEKHYVWVSRLASVFIAVFGGIICLQFHSLADIMLQVPPLLTGAVMIYLVRMLWWRINIQAELAAYLASPIIGSYVQFVLGGSAPKSMFDALPGYGLWAVAPGFAGWETFGQRLITPMLGTTLVFIVVAFCTKPTEMEKLKAFYIRVRPPGPGWLHVRRQIVNPPHADSLTLLLGIWAVGVAFLLGMILGLICIVQGNTPGAILAFVVGAIGGFLLYHGLNRITRIETSDDETVMDAERPVSSEHLTQGELEISGSRS